MRKQIKFLPIILLLTASILSCNFATSKLASKNVEPTATALTVQDVTALPAPVLPVGTPIPGEITITVTDAEVNDWIQQNLDASQESMIENPVVSFTPGTMNINGKIKNGFITADAQLGMSVEVLSDGTIKMHLNSIDVGGMAVPSAMKDMVESTLNSYFDSYLQSITQDYFIESVTINSGEMLISARGR
jgi:hypothetical protein